MNHTIVSGSGEAVVEPVEYNFMGSCQLTQGNVSSVFTEDVYWMISGKTERAFESQGFCYLLI